MKRPAHDLGTWALPAILLSAACARAPDAGFPLSTFQGSWSASGRRHTLPTEGSRTAALVQLSGAVVLTDSPAGFQGEALAFDDGGDLSVGRAVWTDAKGDRVFSTIRGDSLQSGRRIIGIITGGTGRYAGVTGDYTLTWQYIVVGDGEEVRGGPRICGASSDRLRARGDRDA
jgi:hypothetical protein